MKEDTLEQIMKQWQEKLLPLKLSLRRITQKEQEFLEIQDLQTGKKMTVAAKKLEEKVKALGLSDVIEKYTVFLKDWQTLISQPVVIEKERVFPCIRPKGILHAQSAEDLQTYPHTAETIIVLVLDQDRGYKLLTKAELEGTGLSAEEWLQQSLDNLRKLPHSVKKQTVSGNDFYFFHQNDGYDASRILLEDLWSQDIHEEKSELLFSIPHQDVLIIARCPHDNGLEILSKMTMEFYSEGRSPITSFSFHYPNGQSTLEPIFIFLK